MNYLFNKIDDLESERLLFNALDRGIDDMEAGRELPLEEAMQKITELRDARREARLSASIRSRFRHHSSFIS